MKKLGKIAIFGYYYIGREVARQLGYRDYDFVIVDASEENLKRAAEDGFATEVIDFADDTQLRKLGIGRDIGTVFCLLPEDSENVFLTISARALSTTVKIVAVADARDSVHKLKAAGADKVVDPYEITGRKISALIHKPMIADILDNTVFGHTDLNMAETPVVPGSFVDGRSLGELGLSGRYNVIVLGIVDQELGEEFLYTNRGFDHKLDAGDVLVLIGPASEIARFQAEMSTSAGLVD